MHAIQVSFCALQITDNMEKWPEMVARGRPKVHQKSWKVNPGTLQGSSVCIFTQLDHQNASQGHPYDRKRSSGDSNSGVYPEIVRGSWGLAGQHSEGSIKLNRCKPIISSNPSLTSGCNHKGGRRQGRSLRNIIFWTNPTFTNYYENEFIWWE